MKALAWIRSNLFGGWGSALATVVLLAAAVHVLPGLLEWAVLRARTAPDAGACRALEGAGACWGVVAEKWRLVLFGRYPYGEQWRPALALAVVLATAIAAALRWLRGRRLLAAGAAGLLPFLLLMKGGIAGLAPVTSDLWGGLPLTLLLSAAGLAGALPLGILLALGRRSRLPAIRAVCATYVETVRGLPLVPTLFIAAFVFPLVLPREWGGDVLARVSLAIVLFAAAYLAEVVRGGLQSLPPAQSEAATALGLGYWQAQRHVLLPQALRAALPALVGSAISLFKDVSLVTVVGLYELTGSLTLALAGDADWRPFYLEGYLFIGAIYWLGCFGLSQLGAATERRLGAADRK